MENEITQEHTEEEKEEIQPTQKKMSHKKWRALIKKQKRKEKRKAIAVQKLLTEEGSGEGENSATESELFEKQIEQQQHMCHELWVQRERQAQLEWQAKQEAQKREQQRKEEQEQEIREEWEERQKQEKEEEEKQRKEKEEKQKKQDELLKEARSHENKDGPWHNPLAPTMHPGVERKVDHCPFFLKTGACRFGEKCSRLHPKLESSCTLLFPGMYSHFKLSALTDEFDTDMWLEYEESETYQHFVDFYEDVLPEFKSIGRVVQFKVCCNYEPHLRGNVYVQFRREEDAQRAYMQFNTRWYAGKQLSGQFCVVDKWKPAICGQFHQKRCPKGKTCNFLHVFKNPRNEFMNADKDLLGSPSRSAAYGSERRRNRWREESRRKRLNRSRSRSPQNRSSRSHSRRSRSRSNERTSRSSRRSRSRSPGNMSSRSYNRRRSRSKSPGTRFSRSYNRQRSRSRSQSPWNRSSRSYSRKRSRSRSQSPGTMSQRSFRSRSPGNRSNRSLSRRRSRSASPRYKHARSKSVRSRSRSPNQPAFGSDSKETLSQSKDEKDDQNVQDIQHVPDSNGNKKIDISTDSSDNDSGTESEVTSTLLETKTKKTHKKHKKKKKKRSKKHKTSENIIIEQSLD